MLGALVPVHEITKLLTKRDEISLEALGTEKNSWYKVKVDKIKFRNRQA